MWLAMSIKENINTTLNIIELHTYKAHTSPRTDIIRINALLTYPNTVTYTFTRQIEILSLEFREDFQKLLHETDKLDSEVFFVLGRNDQLDVRPNA